MASRIDIEAFKHSIALGLQRGLIDEAKYNILLAVGQYVHEAHVNGKIKSNLESAMNYLKDKKVSYPAKVQVWQVATYPGNRDGLMLSTDRVHRLISEISDVGCSRKTVSDECILTEASAGEDFARNQTLLEEAAGKLGVWDESLIKFSALASSHFSAAGRCFHQEVEHEDARVTMNGKLSLEKLRLHDAIYHDILMNGMDCTVVPRWIIDSVPGFQWLIQAGKNVELAAGEHDLQVMERIHSLAGQHKDPDGRVDFSKIKLAICMSKPKCLPSVPGMFTFVTCNAGSANDPFLLKNARNYVRSCCPSKHSISPDSWKMLNAENKAMSHLPRIRWALVQYLYKYGDGTIKDSDFKKLTTVNLEADRIKANEIMKDLRAATVGRDHVDINRLVGDMEVDIIASLFSLPNSIHSSVDVVAHSFMLNLAKLLRIDKIPSSWPNYEQAAMTADKAFFEVSSTTAAAKASTNDVCMIHALLIHMHACVGIYQLERIESIVFTSTLQSSMHDKDATVHCRWQVV